MWRLTGFADEIDADPAIQLETLGRLGITALELRGAWGKNVLQLDDGELERLATTLGARGVAVSAVASPIGKIGLEEPFPPHLEAFRRGLEIAARLDAPYLRLFSFYLPAGDDPARHRGAVLDRLARLVRAAEGAPVTLLHENEKGIYGDVPARCLDLLTAIASPRFRAAWDPANFVQCGVRPHSDGYAALRPFIAYVHVKDAVRGTGRVVPAGAGDGQLRETIAALRDSGFTGYFSLEPHLAVAGESSGFSGPELFATAAEAFTGLLREQGITWA
jgi:sugar phosphate isomerase/epimerase